MSADQKPAALSQFFRDIREKINQKLLKKFELPWMKSKELDIITEILQKLKPEYCFEWGSGYSTVYFPRILPSVKKWYSIEHHEDWYKVISKEIKDPRVTLEWVKAEDYDVNKARGKYGLDMEGTYEEFKTYVEFPTKLHQSFDFMFIDGRARKDCLRKAYDLIGEQGVVILHDANRTNYVQDLPPFRYTIRFTDYRRVRGGMLIASKGRDLTTVLDVDDHQKAWKGHEMIAKVLFMR